MYDNLANDFDLYTTIYNFTSIKVLSTLRLHVRKTKYIIYDNDNFVIY